MAKKLTAQQNKRKVERLASGQFVQIFYFCATDPRFRQLSSDATKVFVHLRARYSGTNNGNLNIARREMPDFGFGKNGVAFGKAIDELVAKGFVVITRPGSYASGCTLYAITTEPMDACPSKHDYPEEHAPSNLWRKLPCTTPVQDPALHKCNVRRKSNHPCTTQVLVDAASNDPPSTTPVLLYKSTKRSGSGFAAAGVSAAASGLQSKLAQTNTPKRRPLESVAVERH